MYVNPSAVSYRVQMGASDQGGVTGSCELPPMGAANLNQFLCRRVLCSSLLSHHWSSFVLIMQLLKYHDFKMPLTLEEHITLMPFQPRWTTRKTLASLMIACPSTLISYCIRRSYHFTYIYLAFLFLRTRYSCLYGYYA